MPRRRDPDQEEALVRCPRCRGKCTVFDVTTGTDVPCPLCDGYGQVSRHTQATYLRDQP